MKRNIMEVYGRGSESLGEDFWTQATQWLEKGTKVVDTAGTFIQAGRELIGPTQKAQINYVTGSTTGGIAIQPYGTQKSFPIMPVAIGAGALLLVAVLVLKR